MVGSAGTPILRQRGAEAAYGKMQRRCERRSYKPQLFTPEVRPSFYVRNPSDLPLEGDFILALESLGIDFKWEPHRFKLLLARQRIVWFQPDIWLPQQGMYLEITSTKRPKAKLARVAALTAIYGVSAELLPFAKACSIIENPQRLSDEIANKTLAKSA